MRVTKISFEADGATVCLEGRVSPSGELLEVSPVPGGKPQSPALREMSRHLPEVLAGLAPGYIRQEESKSGDPDHPEPKSGR